MELHHILPKFMEGTDKDGRAYLCKKCHDILHKMLPSVMFKASSEKEILKKRIINFSKWWIYEQKNKTNMVKATKNRRPSPNHPTPIYIIY